MPASRSVLKILLLWLGLCRQPPAAEVALKAMASTKRNHVPLMKEVVDSLWSTNFVSWDEKDGDGNTILHLLAAACYYDRFKLLAGKLTKDQLTVVNNKNETPAQVAKTCIAGTLPWNLASLGSRPRGE